jgi:hypothetical protein
MTTIAFPGSHSLVAPSFTRGARIAPVADQLSTLTQPAKLAMVAAAAAVPPITVLHLSATGPVEPTTWTISDYVVTLPYGTPLFAMTTGALAIGAVVLARGLARFTGTRTVISLLAAWAVSMVLLVTFPTNLRGTPEDLSSNIHLYAGAVAFAVLPLAGWLLTRWQRRVSGGSVLVTVLGIASALSGLLSTALILNRFPAVIGMPELMLPPGILQRAAGGMEIVLLAVAGLVILRSATRAVLDRPQSVQQVH